MKRGFGLTCGTVLLFVCATAWPQTQPSDDTDLASGFKIRTTGGLDISNMYMEVVQFDANWKETEEHDIFKPAAQTTADQPNAKVLTGDFPTPGGTFQLTERLEPNDSGVHFSAVMSSDKEIQTNEMSVAFNLPSAIFADKPIVIDGMELNMPAAPATKGHPQIVVKQDAREVDLPTPSGILIITGHLNVQVQDDREWGDPRYALRLHFSPSDGHIKQSKIDLQFQWKPAGG
jgi:hypothetical protein